MKTLNHADMHNAAIELVRIDFFEGSVHDLPATYRELRDIRVRDKWAPLMHIRCKHSVCL